MRSRLADDSEEFGHKAEAVSGGVENIIDICGYTNLALG